jgi:hypothetical protein
MSEPHSSPLATCQRAQDQHDQRSQSLARFTEARRWADSGLLWLTGHPHKAPLLPRVALLGPLAQLTDMLSAESARIGTRVNVDLPVVLSGRAALLGLRRGGCISPGGTCRLLACLDGWLAINLSRPGDAELVPAVVRHETIVDPWTALTETAATLPAVEFCERAQLVGLPVSVLSDDRGGGDDPVTIVKAGSSRIAQRCRPPLVVDLSALWAGPLCAKLLGAAGARIVKVESWTRPDGTRQGNKAFYDWLNAGHESVALDFGCREDIRLLHELVAVADVVIEGSRPRALKALGIDPLAVLAAHPGSIWVSITGYGRSGPDANRAAFGDDAAVAAGLVSWEEHGRPVFCGDALGDPITGLIAAAAAISSAQRGGGELIDVAMANAVRSVIRPIEHPTDVAFHRVGEDDWTIDIDAARLEVSRPSTPPPSPRARPMGADTKGLLTELGLH